MGEFTGAALYTKEEVGKALKNYEILSNNYDNILKQAIEEAKVVDASFKRLGFLWWVKQTDSDVMLEETGLFGSFSYFQDWLCCNNYLSEEDRDWITYYNDTIYLYNTIKDLYNGGKDLYLNPDQARLINKHKNLILSKANIND